MHFPGEVTGRYVRIPTAQPYFAHCGVNVRLALHSWQGAWENIHPAITAANEITFIFAGWFLPMPVPGRRNKAGAVLQWAKAARQGRVCVYYSACYHSPGSVYVSLGLGGKVKRGKGYPGAITNDMVEYGFTASVRNKPVIWSCLHMPGHTH